MKPRAVRFEGREAARTALIDGTTKPERNADEAPVCSTRVGCYFGSYRIFSGAAVPEPANVADTCSELPGAESSQTCGTAGQPDREQFVKGLPEHQSPGQISIRILISFRICRLN